MQAHMPKFGHGFYEFFFKVQHREEEYCDDYFVSVVGANKDKESCIFVVWFISQCIYAGVSTWNALVVRKWLFYVCGLRP